MRESAIGPKQTCTTAPHMSAFGGKADMACAMRMSAIDPKRTSMSLKTDKVSLYESHGTPGEPGQGEIHWRMMLYRSRR